MTNSKITRAYICLSIVELIECTLNGAKILNILLTKSIFRYKINCQYYFIVEQRFFDERVNIVYNHKKYLIAS